MKLYLRTESLRGGGPFPLDLPMPAAYVGPEPPVTVIDVYQPWAVKIENNEVTILDPDWVVLDWQGGPL